MKQEVIPLPRVWTEESSKIWYKNLFGFEPSKYQIDIFNTVEHTNDSIAVSAVAGSGKTTTIVCALKLIPRSKQAIFLAFNKAIVKELTERVPETVNVSTLHSYGCRMLMMNWGRLKINENKVFNLGVKLADRWNIPQSDSKFSYVGRVSKLVDFMRYNLVDGDIEAINNIADVYNIPIFGEEAEDAIELLKLSNKVAMMEIDFADMIYQPAVRDIKMKKYDCVFLDEAQDLNRAQQEMVRKIIKKEGRLIAVGDPYQCQPTGTVIKMFKGKDKYIEDLKIGDRVISYDRSSGGFVGYNNKNPAAKGQVVLDIVKRKIKSKLVELFTDDDGSKYTFNHKCMIRMNKNMITKNTCLIYLMQKGEYFRIGRCRMFNIGKGQGFGLNGRMRSEKADKAWVLDITDSIDEAVFLEQFYAVQFGLPQLCFEPTDTNIYFKEKQWFDLYYDGLKYLLLERAIKCLKFFDKDINCPFVVRNNRYSIFQMSELYAINVFPKYMEMLVYKNSFKGNWREVSEKNIEDYDGYVYSLKIDKYELYVADNILTHNSIYGFAGADHESYERIKTMMPNTVELPLSVCYRCTKSIIRHAQEIVPTIEYFENAGEGVEPYDMEAKDVADGSFVICRNTKPLVQLFIELIRQGKKANIKGKEIGSSIITLIDKTRQKTIEGLFKHLLVHRVQMKTKLVQKGVRNIENHPRWVALTEKIEIIKILSKPFNAVSQLKQYIERIFLDENMPGIVLSTIHKAKGLEADKVYILMPSLMPSVYALTDRDLQQEYNLMYVARTRAKKELIYIQYLPEPVKEDDEVDDSKLLKL